MGGSQSRNEITQLSEQLNEVASSTVQNCVADIAQDQSVREVNTGIWFWSEVKLQQESEIKAECFSSITKQTELQNNLINKISQTTSTQGIALLDAFSAAGSTASANLTNIIRNKVTMSNIQNSYNAIKQKQSVDFENSGLMVYRQVDLTQGSKIFAAATLNELNKAGIFTTIETYLDQKSSTKLDNPLAFLTDLVGSIASGVTGGMVTVVLMFFVIILSPFILIALISRIGGSSNNTVYVEPTPMSNEIAEEPGVESNEQPEEIPPVMPLLDTQPQPQPQTSTQPQKISTSANVQSNVNTAIETASTAVNLLNSLSKKQPPVQSTTA